MKDCIAKFFIGVSKLLLFDDEYNFLNHKSVCFHTISNFLLNSTIIF